MSDEKKFAAPLEGNVQSCEKPVLFPPKGGDWFFSYLGNFASFLRERQTFLHHSQSHARVEKRWRLLVKRFIFIRDSYIITIKMTVTILNRMEILF